MSLKNRPILLVDDDADCRRLMRKILENNGADIQEAQGVDEALALAAQHPPHLAIVDLHMPGKNGFAFLQQRQGSSVLRGTPVIMASALSDRQFIYRAIGLGANDYLIKPFTSAILLQKVRKQLRDASYHSITFKPGQRPTGTLSVPAIVSKFSATGFAIQSSVKIAPNSRVHVEGERIQELRLKDVLMMSTAQPAVRGSNGLYFVRVKLVGIQEGLAQKVGAKRGRSREEPK